MAQPDGKKETQPVCRRRVPRTICPATLDVRGNSLLEHSRKLANLQRPREETLPANRLGLAVSTCHGNRQSRAFDGWDLRSQASRSRFVRGNRRERSRSGQRTTPAIVQLGAPRSGAPSIGRKSRFRDLQQQVIAALDQVGKTRADSNTDTCNSKTARLPQNPKAIELARWTNKSSPSESPKRSIAIEFTEGSERIAQAFSGNSAGFLIS